MYVHIKASDKPRNKTVENRCHVPCRLLEQLDEKIYTSDEVKEKGQKRGVIEAFGINFGALCATDGPWDGESLSMGVSVTRRVAALKSQKNRLKKGTRTKGTLKHQRAVYIS